MPRDSDDRSDERMKSITTLWKIKFSLVRSTISPFDVARGLAIDDQSRFAFRLMSARFSIGIFLLSDASSIDSSTISSRFPSQGIRDFPPIVVCQHANKGKINYGKILKTDKKGSNNGV